MVVGGGYNLASGQWSFVGGGGRQTADPGAAGTYVEDNVAAGDSSTIGGGQGNRTGPNPYSTVAGGRKNTASHFFATVAGGDANTASGYASTIGGGSGNNATADSASVGWGYHNMASDVLSFAAGIYANANANRCVVFSLWSEPPPGMSCFNSSVFRIAADHGFSIDYYSRRSDGGGTRWVQISDLVANVTIATWTGAYLSDAGVWVSGSSSKASKTDFAAVDTRHVLEQVTHLPITTWRYKQGEGEVRHMGPMAEDFDAAFGIGYGPQTIADLDARGVALAAIQGLNQKLDQKLKEKDATTQRLLNKAQQLSREKDAKLARLEREPTLIKKKLGLE